jgi:hypothetical protein
MIIAIVNLFEVNMAMLLLLLDVPMDICSEGRSVRSITPCEIAHSDYAMGN